MQISKEDILDRDGWQCQRCGSGKNLQLAHRIRQGSGTIRCIQNLISKKYKVFLKKNEAEKIMHDEKNIVTSCDRCNDYFNIFFKEVQREELILEIYRDATKTKPTLP